ncbi:PP2C family protein-serine/threonine phosphatase [Corynebacterium sp. 335C]
MTFALDYVTASDRGLVRQNNEDSAYAGQRLLALADGMGGHAAGEVASQLMIAAVSKLDDDEPGDDLLDALAMATAEGNASIAEEVDANPSTAGMGTTLTALLFDGARVGLCHVGDSRGYLLRDGELTQITRDDTYVQTLVDEGTITADEASVHPQRSLILKALTGRPVEPTLKYREARLGDRYLLCSDGLSDPVSRETIAETLAEGTPEQAARRLIDLALKSGGPDNVTIVVADVVDSSAQVPSQPSLAGALGDPNVEAPRPNTSAGRAAAFNPPAEQERAVTSAPGTDQSPAKGRWLVVAFVALVVIALAGVAAWGWQRLQNLYYVDVTATSEQLVEIRSGVPGSFAGIEVNEHFQYVCLQDDGTARLLTESTTPEQADCHLMRASDLTDAARSSLDGLPAESYDEVVAQVNRLAAQALPVCLTTEGDAARGGGGDPAGGDGAAEGSSAASETNDAAAGGEADGKAAPAGSRPGIDCREVTR